MPKLQCLLSRFESPMSYLMQANGWEEPHFRPQRNPAFLANAVDSLIWGIPWFKTDV